MEYLSAEEIREIHDAVLQDTGGLQGVLRKHALLMLDNPPLQSHNGFYPGIFIKTAFYVQSINRGHIFVDGNKRTSMVVIRVFLKKNGYIFDPPGKTEVEKFTHAIANGTLLLKETASWIEKYSFAENITDKK